AQPTGQRALTARSPPAVHFSGVGRCVAETSRGTLPVCPFRVPKGRPNSLGARFRRAAQRLGPASKAIISTIRGAGEIARSQRSAIAVPTNDGAILTLRPLQSQRATLVVAADDFAWFARRAAALVAEFEGKPLGIPLTVDVARVSRVDQVPQLVDQNVVQ